MDLSELVDAILERRTLDDDAVIVNYPRLKSWACDSNVTVSI